MTRPPTSAAAWPWLLTGLLFALFFAVALGLNGAQARSDARRALGEQATMVELSSALRQGDADVRAFCKTGEPAALIPYQRALSAAESRSASFNDFEESDPAQRERTAAVRKLVQRKFKLWRRRIANRSAPSPNQQLELHLLDRDQVVAAALDSELSQMRERTNRELSMSQRLGHAVRLRFAILLGCVACALLALTLAPLRKQQRGAVQVRAAPSTPPTSAEPRTLARGASFPP